VSRTSGDNVAERGPRTKWDAWEETTDTGNSVKREKRENSVLY